MDYDDAVAAFFRTPPEGAPAPRTDAEPTPARRLRDAIEPIAMVAVWSPEVNERHRGLGLDFLSGYVFGRAAPLGIAPTSLVVATFGVFSPAVVGSAYETGLATCSHGEVLAALEEGTIAAMHRLLGPPLRDVEEVVTALRGGLERAELLGRPLFAGLSARDWPGDPWGRLWRAATLLREYRGDGHLAACVAAGLGPIAANLLTEAHVGLDRHPGLYRSYTASRGWTEAEIDDATAGLVDAGLLDAHGAITERGRTFRDGIEADTEAGMDGVLEGIGHALDTVVRRCTRWSADIVAGGSFPPDPFKRAAG